MIRAILQYELAVKQLSKILPKVSKKRQRENVHKLAMIAACLGFKPDDWERVSRGELEVSVREKALTKDEQ